MGKTLGEFVRDWNKIIYRNDDGSFIKDRGMEAEDFWKEFSIRSAPKFADACWSHIPARWADEVREMLRKAQQELGEQVEFIQIKEKLCRLTVYYSSADDHAKQRMSELITECTEKLINKGVHPPTQEKEND